MRSASLIAVGLLVLFVALTHAEDKTTPPPEKKMPKARAFLGTFDEIEGKNLPQWANDLLDKDPSVREKAISVIPVYGPSATQLIPQIIECLDPNTARGKDLGTRVTAIQALGVMELPESEKTHVVIALANRLEHDGQDAARLAAALSLTRFGEEGKPAINALISGINDTGSWRIRRASILALRRIGSDKKEGPQSRATDSLSILALHDPAFQVRIEAIQAIGYMDKPKDKVRLERVHRALMGLTNVNANTKDNDIILAMWAHVSMMALTEVTDKEIKDITQHLSSPALEVRGQGLLCMGTLGMKAKSAAPDVVKMLKDKDLGIVILACWTLASIGEDSPRVLDAMTELAGQKDLREDAREQVKAAIEAVKKRKTEAITEKPGDKRGEKKDPRH